MNPQETAAGISAVIAGLALFAAVATLQGWALLAALAWLKTGISLSLFQATIIVVLIRSLQT